jgi:hypothetical protein
MPWGNGGELEAVEAEVVAEEAEEAEEQVACGDDDVACAAYGQKSTEIRYEMFKCRADSVSLRVHCSGVTGHVRHHLSFSEPHFCFE